MIDELNDMFEYTEVIKPVVIPKKTDKFNPRQLSELIDDLYDNQPAEMRKFITEEILQDRNNKGTFWERCLAKHMPHTIWLRKNTWYKDYSDGSDAKFCTAVRYASGVFQASINAENKTGTLRVCMAGPGDNPKLYFMLIPYSYYSKRPVLNSPMKITFESFRPIGDIWDNYQCSWEQVISPVDNKSVIMYTDDYQYLLDSYEIRTNRHS